jgi:uncharacterized membrane protein
VILLVFGVLLWSGVHLFPSVAAPARKRLIGRLGTKTYRGLFALSLVVALVLIVVGWRSTTPSFVYQPPTWAYAVTEVAVFIGVVLFVASGVPTNLKRWLRHPQLTGVAVWAGAHLLSNGHQRSLVLFGAFFAWALAEMVLINRRDGPRGKPAPLPFSADLKPLVAGVVVYALAFSLHPYDTGVSPPLP